MQAEEIKTRKHCLGPSPHVASPVKPLHVSHMPFLAQATRVSVFCDMEPQAERERTPSLHYMALWSALGSVISVIQKRTRTDL